MVRSSEVCLFISKLQDFKVIYSSLSNKLQATTAQASRLSADTTTVTALDVTSVAVHSNSIIEIILSIPLLLGMSMNHIDTSASLLVTSIHSVITFVGRSTSTILNLYNTISGTTNDSIQATASAAAEDGVNASATKLTRTRLKDSIKSLQKILQRIIVVQVCNLVESECSINSIFAHKLFTTNLTTTATASANGKEQGSVDVRVLLVSFCTDIDIAVQKLLQTALSVSSSSKLNSPTVVPTNVQESTSKQIEVLADESKSDAKYPFTTILPLLHDTKRQLKALKLILLSGATSTSTTASTTTNTSSNTPSLLSSFVPDQCNKTD